VLIISCCGLQTEARRIIFVAQNLVFNYYFKLPNHRGRIFIFYRDKIKL
jgi:hypothetical protein